MRARPAAYTTTDSVHDGAFRKIVIRVSRPGFSVRAKTGYLTAQQYGCPPTLPAAL